MRILNLIVFVAILVVFEKSYSQAKIMNPGEAIGQLVVLTEEDVQSESAKYKTMNPLSIPVFPELPLDMSVVAGAITLKEQSLLSHVQLKSKARRTPNLDISKLEGGLDNALFNTFKDGDWVSISLKGTDQINIQPSTQDAAIEFYKNRKQEKIKLQADLQFSKILPTNEISWKDFDKVGSKAANYAQLATALNSDAREIVRQGYAIPFYYYQEFIDSNPRISQAIQRIDRDPLMKKVERVEYRQQKLTALRDLILSNDSVINQNLVDELLALFESQRSNDGKPLKMKLRSSTNSEDLPNFNGAGLYTSEAYKPSKDGVEKTKDKKEESIKEALRIVWASIWNLRAFDERNYFQIPHIDVKMGIQINPSYVDEFADGVVVTKNIVDDPKFPGDAVYIEAQRGSTFSVANPDNGVKATKILVSIDPADLLNKNSYIIHILQRSNVADNANELLPHENPTPVMSDEEIKDLVQQSLKAEIYFKPLLGETNTDFSLDLEFKVGKTEKGTRAIFLKQARPYLN